MICAGWIDEETQQVAEEYGLTLTDYFQRRGAQSI
jgi:hypothetical protein